MASLIQETALAGTLWHLLLGAGQDLAFGNERPMAWQEALTLVGMECLLCMLLGEYGALHSVHGIETTFVLDNVSLQCCEKVFGLVAGQRWPPCLCPRHWPATPCPVV